MILPSRDEFVRLAADHDVVPVAREVYADLATPISAFMALAEGAEHAFLLESVIGGERLGRYSFLGVGDREVITARGNEVVVENGGVHGERADDPLRVVAARARGGQRRARAGAAAVRRRRGRLRRLRDGARLREGAAARRTTSSACPTSCFMLADVVVAFDHARRVMQVIAPVRPGGAPELAYDAALKRIDSYLRAHRRRARAAPSSARWASTRRGAAAGAHARARSSSRRSKRAKEHIAAGDIFQVVLVAALLGARTRATASTSTACCARSTRARTCSTSAPAT